MIKYFNYSIFLSCAISILFCVSCGDNSKKKENNFPKPRNNGHFLMYYYPTNSLYISESGTEFTKSASGLGNPAYITADENGKLYSAISGFNVSVMVSDDEGESWSIVENSSTHTYDYADFSIVAGKANTVYALSSQGDFFVTKDAGVNWIKQTTPCVKDTSHSSGVLFNTINLAVSADGEKILAQAWYFDETVLSISYDEGKSWVPLNPPTEINEAKGVGFCGDRIVYASYDHVFYSDNLGKTWNTSKPEKILAFDCESTFFQCRNFVTDGDKFVLGVELPSAEDNRDKNNKYPGAIFLSIDGGETFKTYPFPYNVDQTPKVSDEYVFLTFVSRN